MFLYMNVCMYKCVCIPICVCEYVCIAADVWTTESVFVCVQGSEHGVLLAGITV